MLASEVSRVLHAAALAVLAWFDGYLRNALGADSVEYTALGLLLETVQLATPGARFVWALGRFVRAIVFKRALARVIGVYGLLGTALVFAGAMGAGYVVTAWFILPSLRWAALAAATITVLAITLHTAVVLSAEET